ncbi:hypothetical protein HZU73_07044 [Apis mellifera caucasica]|uniref:Uncharacterized protein LOC726722 n=1 Tax=Apis mellifera TaxID=7460 RepID=A0A7M7MH87_APIME|nr:uncharacterized protein LOC726722 [Apis mellifera]KAG6797724.1 hypothetical protein HZU73_07044 [Apis mellifera caucasica]KAG9437575.1 hypothetical protein HZU67_00584 [Apis mellifera carnica]|eukprot:XP_026297324.1 uncharacterized protein LOC726722 [Apis mellifera]
MILPKDLILLSSLIFLRVSAAFKISTRSPWINITPKPVYARALGPISEMDTITVPYISKSPFFPKFVDPKIMISKKTDLLTNLFGNLGSAYPMSFKSFIPYAISGSSIYSTVDKSQLLGKNNVDDDTHLYKRGIFNPFNSKSFDPMNSKFESISQFSNLNTLPDYSMKNDFSHKKRSIDKSSVANLKSIMNNNKSETKGLGFPSLSPTLAPIFEEPEEDINIKKIESATVPKQYLSEMFEPYDLIGPMVDPSMFIIKKSAFLDNLFKNIAITPSLTSTEAPTTKNTIVPSDFWLPSGIPNPIVYNEKVTEFLNKLFENLKLNKTMTFNDDNMNVKNVARSIISDKDNTQVKIARSVEDLSSINAAKDSIVNSILSELSDLKSNMITTMNDLISYEKSITSPTKSFKSFDPSSWSKSLINGVFPFQQKMAILSQVFDMLTNLQKNITLEIQNVIKTKIISPERFFNANYPIINDVFSSSMPINMSLLDAIKYKLDTLDYGMPVSYIPSFDKFGSKMVRTLLKNSPFWISYPKNIANIKQEIKSESLMNEKNNFNQKQTRSVKMQIHQGYQSLPIDSIESVQTDGQSTSEHQGEEIKLFDINNYEDIDKWVNWMKYLKNKYRRYQHHNHY